MTISMYQASVPAFIRMLDNLKGILEKGAAHAEAKKFDPAVLINSRLYPDMFPLSRQVQIATDNAKGCPSRLAGIDPPKYEDTESTFPELYARIDKTIALLKTFKPDQIDGSEEKPIMLSTPRGTLNFKGQAYLLNFVLPNFHFHVTTAYNILRHNGVELGKTDYLGAPQQ
ncbi:MAG: DUF1993 domain-containing protein [Pseudomonadota bacterium]|nr:DUF1993 domain-containing protein [Pseudomonadota bacterium]